MFQTKLLYPGILFLSLVSLQVNAQLYLGIEGGATRNYLHTNASNLVSTQYNPAYGFTAGIPILYQINEWLAVQADPNYFQKNYQMERTDFFQGVYQDNTNAYIQLPVMAHFSFGGARLKGFLNVGGYGGYWVSGKVKGREPNILNQPAFTNTISNAQPNTVFDEFTPYNYNEKYAFNNTKDNRLEFGLLSGAGISYELKNKYRFFGEARYYRSMTDQQKKYQMNQVPRFNDSYVISIGCLVKIKFH